MAKFNKTDSQAKFLISKAFGAVAGAGVAYIEIIVPNTTFGRQVSISNLSVIADQLVQLELIEAPTITDGTTAVTIANRDRTVSKTANTTAFSDPTAISAGTKLLTYTFNTTGTNNPPATDGEYLDFNLKKNTKYLIKLTNLNGTTATTFCNVLIDLFEI